YVLYHSLCESSKDFCRHDACTDSDRDIFGTAQVFNLPVENLLETEIVPHRGEDGGISGQSDRWQSCAFNGKSTDKLSRQVLSIRCATAISKQQKLVARLQAAHDQRSRFDDCRTVLAADFHPQFRPFGQSGHHASGRYFKIHKGGQICCSRRNHYSESLMTTTNKKNLTSLN